MSQEPLKNEEWTLDSAGWMLGMMAALLTAGPNNRIEDLVSTAAFWKQKATGEETMTLCNIGRVHGFMAAVQSGLDRVRQQIASAQTPASPASPDSAPTVAMSPTSPCTNPGGACAVSHNGAQAFYLEVPALPWLIGIMTHLVDSGEKDPSAIADIVEDILRYQQDVTAHEMAVFHHLAILLGFPGAVRTLASEKLVDKAESESRRKARKRRR